MSLKQFHLFFIALSILILFGFGIWGIQAYLADKSDGVMLSLAILAIVSAVGLIVYDVLVYRKFKTLGG